MSTYERDASIRFFQVPAPTSCYPQSPRLLCPQHTSNIPGLLLIRYPNLAGLGKAKARAFHLSIYLYVSMECRHDYLLLFISGMY